MEAAKVFAMPVDVNIPGVKGKLRPIAFDVLCEISEKIIAERLDAIPKAEDLIKALDPTKIPLDVYRTVVADAAYQVADMREKARKVDLNEVTSKLEDMFFMPKIVSLCFVKEDGSQGDKNDGMQIVQYITKHGMNSEECNLTRWFQISGVIEESDPTKSATAS